MPLADYLSSARGSFSISTLNYSKISPGRIWLPCDEK